MLRVNVVPTVFTLGLTLGACNNTLHLVIYRFHCNLVCLSKPILGLPPLALLTNK